jgi:hypothetical protein
MSKRLCMKETNTTGNDPHKEEKVYVSLIKHFAVHYSYSRLKREMSGHIMFLAY